MYYICGLWPPDNVSCLFLTWYQSPGLGHPPHAATRALIQNFLFLRPPSSPAISVVVFHCVISISLSPSRLAGSPSSTSRPTSDSAWIGRPPPTSSLGIGRSFWSGRPRPCLSRRWDWLIGLAARPARPCLGRSPIWPSWSPPPPASSVPASIFPGIAPCRSDLARPSAQSARFALV
jgi:hypothetical protein